MLAASTILVLASISAADQPQLYEFTAPWCPACRNVEPVVAELQAQGVPIQRVNVDKQRAWAKQAQVSSLPCFIAVANGQEVGRLVGAASRNELSGLYLQAVQYSRRTAAAHNSKPAPNTIAKDGKNTEMVRGQTPRRPSPGKRLGQALSSLRGRSKQNPAVEGQAVSAEPNSYPSRPVGHVAAESVLDKATASQRALEATVRIKIVDAVGQSYGTGTIIDVHENEALVLTCGHIFRDSDGKGRILCDAFAPGAKPGIEGKLISYDLRRDVGLITFHPGVKVTAAFVGGIGHRPREGDPVFSVGCSHGADPTVIENKIISVNRYHGPPNLVVGGRPVDGRSGGGLFTQEGLLIGVCNAADPEYDEGLYAALGNVHSELDAVGLGYVYRSQTPGTARGDSLATRPAATNRQDQPRERTIPVSAPLADQAGASSLANPQSRGPSGGAQMPADATERQMNNNEQELICIVRSRNDPQPKSVFVLDRPSASLLNRLATEANRRGPHQSTQMHVGNEAPSVTKRRPAVGGHRPGDWRSLAASEIDDAQFRDTKSGMPND